MRALPKLFLWLLLLTPAWGGSLPTFENFRRVDRLRRLTGQLQTDDLLNVTRMDAQLLIATAEKNPDDWQLQWGAAELLVEWPVKRAFFEAAIQKSQTNVGVVMRCALFAAQHRDQEVALPWLRFVQKKETDNIVPWLSELWWWTHPQPGTVIATNEMPQLRPTLWATNFRDYAASAARARVRLLEAAGYSAYSARRLGFMPDTPAPQFARELASVAIKSEGALEILDKSAKALQAGAPFLLYEFVGQTLESALLLSQPDAENDPEVRYRNVELDSRREELKKLLAEVGNNVVDIATEQEMVRYFDDVLTFGEENALLNLAQKIRAVPGQ